jgi:endonuclease/exonuclease/phosphatase family metal-dependent hydrolase
MKYAVSSVVLLLAACGTPPGRVDGGTDSGTEFDAGLDVDSGAPDAGAPDGGSMDAGAGDAGAGDAGEADAGLPDSGTDAGELDGGADAGVDGGEDAGGSGVDGGGSDGGADGGPTLDAGYDAGAGCPVPSFTGTPFRLRAMAANLTSGNNQSYDPGHGIRLIKGADPDVVMIQEFNYGANSPADLASLVQQVSTDAGFVYARGQGSIPNGVISRWPILASGEWVDSQTGTRGFTWAQVDLPGPNDLWVVSVHLLTANPTTRNTQAAALIANLNSMIPASDYVLLGGDLNTDTRDAGQEPCFATFAPRLKVEGPHPADQNGVEGTSAPRTKPYDQVLPSYCLANLQIPSVIGSSTYDAGAVIDTRVYTPLTDLAPALQGDSAAPSMQHMGVVKDFLLQP